MGGNGKPETPPDTSLVDLLMTPAAFEHPVDDVELIETHISWVILAGDYVYKIKRPVKLDFLDFASLERRRHFCDEEVRLNRYWAPEIYLDVVPITIENGQARVGGKGQPVEFAVRMRRFDQKGLLNRELERGTLTATDMIELAVHVAERHLEARRVPASNRNRIIRLTKQFIWDNFAALDGVADDTELQKIHQWTERELQNLDDKLEQRFDEGFVRVCHGDLHLRNLARLPGGITAFDCIEFDKDLRHTDVFGDVAFLVMDLVARRRHDLAAHFLNRYLERTGDYDGMTVFSLYFVYRCLVRAKVAAIRSQQPADDVSEIVADRDEMRFYCGVARRQIAPRVPILIVMCGLSGSGKTWLSTQLMAAMPAVRVRSDLERKRMFGLHETADSASEIDEGIYTPDASRNVYERLFESAGSILMAGHSVILDAAFLRSADRRAAIEIAQSCAAAPVIVSISAPVEVLRERVLNRKEGGADASEAGISVLEHQLQIAEPVTADEGTLIIDVDSSGDVDVTAITARIKESASA